MKVIEITNYDLVAKGLDRLDVAVRYGLRKVFSPGVANDDKMLHGYRSRRAKVIGTLCLEVMRIDCVSIALCQWQLQSWRVTGVRPLGWTSWP